MTLRLLEPHEYPRLLGMPLIEALPDPAHSRVVVAETEEGNIVGYWCAQEVVHIEPAWVHPRYRRKGLATRLFQHLRAVLDACHIPAAFCHVQDPDLVAAAMNLQMTPLHATPLLWERKETT